MSRQVRVTQITVTAVALAFAAIHMGCPSLTVDTTTLTLLIAAMIPWIAELFKAVEMPGGWKFEFQELRKATQDQANTTLHQTVATIISWVQAEDIRNSRRVLYQLQKEKNIKELPGDKWQEEWQQHADRVGQSFNSAAIIAKLDERLQEIWVRPSRRPILKSWLITNPRIVERRQKETGLWNEFEWLAETARRYCTEDDLSKIWD